MPSINDFFGKASIDNNYAIATTVKTTRTSGATVLEAVDLSKFSDTTPVFFVTYKKTTDPVTNVTSVVDLVSWKGLVNTGANTLTNLELAPGYTDIGNDVGDFVESIPTSLWNKDLIDGILVSHNQDGTLKDGVVTNAKLSTTAGELGGAWQTWTSPIKSGINGGTGFSESAAYTQIGKTVFFRYSITLGTSPTIADIRMNAPVDINTNHGDNATLGQAIFMDNVATGGYGNVRLVSLNEMRVLIYNSAGTYLVASSLNSTTPFTWASGDKIQLSGTYQAI